MHMYITYAFNFSLIHILAFIFHFFEFILQSNCRQQYMLAVIHTQICSGN